MAGILITESGVDAFGIDTAVVLEPLMGTVEEATTRPERKRAAKATQG